MVSFTMTADFALAEVRAGENMGMQRRHLAEHLAERSAHHLSFQEAQELREGHTVAFAEILARKPLEIGAHLAESGKA
jgi:hypothetical protein